MPKLYDLYISSFDWIESLPQPFRSVIGLAWCCLLALGAWSVVAIVLRLFYLLLAS